MGDLKSLRRASRIYGGFLGRVAVEKARKLAYRPYIGARRLFIHVPKSGGLSIRVGNDKLADRIIVPGLTDLSSTSDGLKLIRHTLQNGRKTTNVEHARWRDVSLDLRSRCRAFSVVRNPWDRCVSRYTYARKLGQDQGFSFGDWLKANREDFEAQQGDFNCHAAIDGWAEAYDYVSDEEGRVVCDILRFEHIDQDVAAYFGLEDGYRLPRRNVSNGIAEVANPAGQQAAPRRDYRAFYDDALADQVGSWFARDIAWWGFDFDHGAVKNTWMTCS